MNEKETTDALHAAGIPTVYHDPEVGFTKVFGGGQNLELAKVWHDRAVAKLRHETTLPIGEELPHLKVRGGKQAQDVMFYMGRNLTRNGIGVRMLGLQTIRDLFYENRDRLFEETSNCAVVGVLGFQDDHHKFERPFPAQEVMAIDWWFQQRCMERKVFMLQWGGDEESCWWSRSLEDRLVTGDSCLDLEVDAR